MFKYLIIVNLLVMMVVTQDVPPSDLEIPTEAPTTTTTELITVPPTTTEAITVTTAIVTTSTTENPKTTTITTTIEPSTTATTETAEPTTSTTPLTTKPNYIPWSTDSPYSTTTSTTEPPIPNHPFYPSYPDYSHRKCYFKKQYGHVQLRWTCHGFKYVYLVECFKCCLYEFYNFAGCYRVHGDYCKNTNHHHGFYK